MIVAVNGLGDCNENLLQGTLTGHSPDGTGFEYRFLL
jgi:hypothetical protein